MLVSLEALLRRAGRELADWQVCRFWKIPEEMQQTPCDFMGFTAWGRAVLIEAKQVNRTSLPISNSPGLLPHQFGALEECNRAGGLALVCWARGDECAVLSFDQVLEFSYLRRSIPWGKIEKKYLRSMSGPRAHLELLSQWLPIKPS